MLEFPSSMIKYHNRPVWLVPVVPFEDGDRKGIEPRGMNGKHGGGHATYSSDAQHALVATSKTLSSYYALRTYARMVGRMVYDPNAPALPHAGWFPILDEQNNPKE